MAETGKGLRIVAEERDCRLMCMKLLETNFEEQVFFGVGVFDGLRRDVEVLRGLLADIFPIKGTFMRPRLFRCW